MAKFKYSMQSIYNIKMKMEDQAKSQYAEARARLNEELECLETLRKKKQEILKEGVRLRLKSLNFLDLRNNQLSSDLADASIASQQARILAARKNMDAAERRLKSARQERKMQETLREKAFEEFKKEIEKEESKQVDELTSYKYGEKAKQQQKKEREGHVVPPS